MFFSWRLGLPDVISLCRVLRHSLAAGLTLRDVFRQQAERGSPAVRRVCQRLLDAVNQGESLDAALARGTRAFPALFIAMAGVGEETGHLAEIFGELEKYYTLQLRLRRQFRSQSLLPIIQVCLAFFVIAGLIFVLGLIAAPGSQPTAVLGFRGPGGAVAFLGVSFGVLAALLLGYKYLPVLLRQKAWVDQAVLRIPGVGPCLEALVLGRFALALQLTLDSSLPIRQALRLSLQATGNAYFSSKIELVTQMLKEGKDLTDALTQSGLFPEQFLNMVAVGEQGGRVPEIMSHQAAYYHEEAERRLTLLVRMASLGVWFVYAGFMVIMIFSIASMYFAALP